MKLYKKILMGVGVTILTTAALMRQNYLPLVKTNSSFSAKDNIGNIVGYGPVDIDNDKRPDVMMASYDLTKDGKADVLALYRIIGIDPFTKSYISDENAIAVFVEKKHDGIIDYALFDNDLNGTLETKVKGEEFNKVNEHQQEKQPLYTQEVQT